MDSSTKKLKISSLAELKAEKMRLQTQIDQSGDALSNVLSNIPGQAIGSTIGIIAGSFAKSLLSPSPKLNNCPPQTYSYSSSSPPDEVELLSEKLVSVGEDTVRFALLKLVERLVEK